MTDQELRQLLTESGNAVRTTVSAYQQQLHSQHKELVEAIGQLREENGKLREEMQRPWWKRLRGK